MASCRSETQAYRQCLKDSRSSGGGGTKKCMSLAHSLETCRERFRQEQNMDPVQFDGSRILLNPKCKPLNQKVQNCLKWKNGSEELCQAEIQALKRCMKDHSQGTLAPATEGDKVWSDYKGSK